jgi:hypothetical protein
MNSSLTFSSPLALRRSVVSLTLAIGVCLVGLMPGELGAAPPSFSLIPFKRVDGDPEKSYELTAENGPWTIFATSFAGEGAEKQAHELILELRQKHKLPAYMHKQHYDFTEKVRGLGVNKYGDPKQMKYARATKEFDEIAVMVGNYAGLEDSELQKTLQKIKFLKPQCLDRSGKKPTTQRYATLREFQKMVTPDKDAKVKGPMAKAFATRNPLLPEDYDAIRGLDPAVVDWNRNAEFSLLSNPGKYTVKVATFRGVSTWKKDEIEQLERGQMRSRLEEAATKANKLAKALRTQGIEAYEFHDRNESIVCIGSFDSVGTPRADGKIEINPAVHKIMKEYGAQQLQLPGQANLGLQPRQLKGINFDVQPMPVEVPRVSVAANLSRGLLQ